ncbi:MAG: hypothetical protein CL569_02430 [Alphaproteobacteria bacterium]|nr:hypothetical protein [Alphaproteobacteria bacterium]|tara:strand:+ start:92 stop:334 length:243 start_codon:yes stop_codon:yes gene_type:complete
MKERIAAIRRHPNSWLRRTVGVSLIVGGVLGFLPVLGFWMLPLGFLVLSDDIPWVRRQRRRLEVSGGRQWRQFCNRLSGV